MSLTDDAQRVVAGAQQRVARAANVLSPARLAALAAAVIGTLVWAIMMLTARGAMAHIFSGLGISLASLETLKRAVAACVGVFMPLMLALSTTNVWLVYNGGGRGPARQQRLSWLALANHLSVFLSAFALAGAFAWFVDMKLVADAAKGAAGPPGPSPWWPPAAPNAGAPAPPPAPVNVAASTAAAAAAPPPPPAACPSGCADMGFIAAALGLPLRCVCLPGFLFKQLADDVGSVVGQLAGALVGALLMLAGASGLSTASALDVAQGGGPVWGVGGGGGLGEPLLPGGA